MRRALLTLVALLSLAAVVVAQTGYAHQHLTVAATAIGVTMPADRPVAMHCTVETASIRYWYDGALPTASEGHLAVAGSGFDITGANNVAQWRAIRTGATSADVFCSFAR